MCLFDAQIRVYVAGGFETQELPRSFHCSDKKSGHRDGARVGKKKPSNANVEGIPLEASGAEGTCPCGDCRSGPYNIEFSCGRKSRRRIRVPSCY